jgi:predicted O-methyltransferase YrrM
MLSDVRTGALLRVLAASKPGGKILELGTGTGLSLSWLAQGADNDSRILSLDNNALFQEVAKSIFSNDSRVEFQCLDANLWLTTFSEYKFDLIFADAFPGKFENVDAALNLIATGGFYVIDDLYPQANWPENHQVNVDRLLSYLYQRDDLIYTPFDWSTGVIVFTKIAV